MYSSSILVLTLQHPSMRAIPIPVETEARASTAGTVSRACAVMVLKDLPATSTSMTAILILGEG